MDKIINRVLKECVGKFILNERLSSILYHFTGIGALYKILINNSFKLRSSFGRKCDDLHKNKKFYLSCTRQRSGSIGYGKNLNVRITLNGDLLNNRYEGGPIDYWSGVQGKTYYYNKKYNETVPYIQSTTESEDRIFSNEPFIKDALKYITRVDVLYNDKYKHHLSYLYHLLTSGFSKILFIYDNKEDFNKQNDKTINENILSESGLGETIPYERNSYIDSTPYRLANLMSFFIFVDDKQNKYNEYCSKMLREYGLGDYISKVLPKINRYFNANYFDGNVLDDLRTSSNDDIYSKSFTMLRDFLRKRGFKNINDALKFGTQHYVEKNNKWALYDDEKVIKVFAYQPYGNTSRYGNTIILHPEKTLFWDIEDVKHGKQFFISDIERLIKSHKSPNDDSFHKYLQHMVKGKITVSQMLNFFNRLDVHNENIIEYLFGGNFRNIDMEYYYIDDQKYVNKNDKIELEQMFKK